MQGNFGVLLRRPPTADSNRGMDLTRTGHLERINQSGVNGGVVRRLETADQNRRILPDSSGQIWRFHFAARPQNVTAVSPKMVKPREKPMAFSNGDLRVKIGT